MPDQFETINTPKKPGPMHPVLAAILSGFFSLIGLCAAAAAIYLGMTCVNTKPILLSPPDSAVAQLTAMLDAVCDSDYEKAASFVLGTPDLGADTAFEDALGQLLWSHFTTSMAYTLEGECYTTDDGLAQDITFSYLDMTSITETLRSRSQAMLAQRVEEAEDTSEVYNEKNEYREDVVMEILFAAAEDALAEDARTVTVPLTVNLKYRDGQWWIVADTALLDAISGGILF